MFDCGLKGLFALLFLTSLLTPGVHADEPKPNGQRAVRAGATTLQFRTDAGTLIVEVDDPAVKVTLDRDELKITGAGLEVLALNVGPHLTGAAKAGRNELLTVNKGDRVIVRVRIIVGAGQRLASKEALIGEAKEVIGEIPKLRLDLDERLWEILSSSWIHIEAAKLLIQFHQGDGRVPDTTVPPAVADRFRADLLKLRELRARAFALLAEAAQGDVKPAKAVSMVGAWEIVEMRGGGGLLSASLSLFDPDPVGKKLVVVEGLAALHNASALLIYDVAFPDDTPGALDLTMPIRPNTTIRGLYRALSKDEVTLRMNPINEARPTVPDGKPSDGGLVLRLRRIGAS